MVTTERLGRRGIEICRRMLGLFDAFTDVDRQPRLLAEIRPGFDVGPFVGDLASLVITTAVAGNGDLVVWTCPDNEYWLMHLLNVNESGGTFVSDDPAILPVDSATAILIGRNTISSSITVYTTQVQHIWMRPGDTVHITISGFSVAGDFVCGFLGRVYKTLPTD